MNASERTGHKFDRAGEPSAEAMRAVRRICEAAPGLHLNPEITARLIDAEFAELRESDERLRVACEAVVADDQLRASCKIHPVLLKQIADALSQVPR